MSLGVEDMGYTYTGSFIKSNFFIKSKESVTYTCVLKQKRW